MTQPYRFHPLAEEQQDDIWYYTYQTWGVEQADNYIDGLHKKLAEVATSEFQLLTLLPAEIAKDVHFFRYGRHYVFVRQSVSTLLVLTLLHERMDIPARLGEMLESL